MKGLTPEETDAVHECLSWARDNNNRIFDFFGTVYESFHNACGSLLDKFRTVIPSGCPRARIRVSRRDARHPTEGELGDTLHMESVGSPRSRLPLRVAPH